MTTQRTVTITYGERVENHARMEMIGTLGAKGLSVDDLCAAQTLLSTRHITSTLIDLTSYAPKEVNVDSAAVLVIHNGVRQLGFDPNAMLKEHFTSYHWDKKALMYGRVVNKHARWNVCFADFEQEPSYHEGRGRVVKFNSVPITQALRHVLSTFFGSKTSNLKAEGNYYYNARKCGIGFHGDSERKIVIAARLGSPLPLHYQWFHKSKPIGQRCVLALRHGDIYIMSEKATGNDWRKSSLRTLRHATGCSKFTTIKNVKK